MLLEEAALLLSASSQTWTACHVRVLLRISFHRSKLDASKRFFSKGVLFLRDCSVEGGGEAAVAAIARVCD